MLIVAALAWFGLHIGIAGTNGRAVIARALGEEGFRSVFSLLSIGLLIGLVFAYRAAPTHYLWTAPAWLRDLLALGMLAAFVLFVGSVSQTNPTGIGGEQAIAKPVRGIVRVTRHPMLWSFAIWGAVHVIGNGDTASIIFFGAFLVTALAGMPSIDHKLARRDPGAWQCLAAATSIVPFAAIAQRRNRFAPGEYGWARLAAAVIAWGAVLAVHPWLFGARPLG